MPAQRTHFCVSAHTVHKSLFTFQHFCFNVKALRQLHPSYQLLGSFNIDNFFSYLVVVADHQLSIYKHITDNTASDQDNTGSVEVVPVWSVTQQTSCLWCYHILTVSSTFSLRMEQTVQLQMV